MSYCSRIHQTENVLRPDLFELALNNDNTFYLIAFRSSYLFD